MARSYSMDGRAELVAATRRRLLAATTEVLAEVGGAALTMPAVAGRAGMALRTVYNYFPSKEALVLEAYNQLVASTQAALQTRLAEGSAPDRLVRFVETFCDSYQEQSPGAAVVFNVSGIPAFDERLAEVRRWRRAEITKLVRAASREGVLRTPVKEAVALVFLVTAYATWDSVATQSGLSPAAAKALLTRTVEATLFG